MRPPMLKLAVIVAVDARFAGSGRRRLRDVAVRLLCTARVAATPARSNHGGGERKQRGGRAGEPPARGERGLDA